MDYFKKSDLNQPLNLDRSGRIQYHWSNDVKAITKYRMNFENKKGMKVRYLGLKNMCDRFDQKVVWLSSKKGKRPTTLKQIYESYLDPRIRLLWPDMEDIMVSFDDPLGPYTSLKSMRWFKEDIYRVFIYRKMFESWMPTRDYRLGLHLDITVAKEKNPFDSRPASIHQVTYHGFLLRFKEHDRSFLAMRSGGQFLHFKKSFDKSPNVHQRYSKMIGLEEWWSSIQDFQVCQDYISDTLNEERYRQGFYSYIFIPFEAMSSNKLDTQLIKELLAETQDFVHSYLDVA